MKRSYRVDEVAEELSVSPRTIQRLIQRGELQSYRIGDTRTRRIDLEEMERLKKKEPNGSA